MSKAKYIAAKGFIDAKRYDDARAILEKIDEPRARDWLAKLDRIAPRVQRPPAIPSPPPLHSALPYQQQPMPIRQQPERKQSPLKWILIPGCLLIVLAVGIIVVGFVSRAATNMIAGVPLLQAPCSLRDWWDTSAEPIAVQFLDTAETASQTSRMSLSSVVIEMRQTQRDFEHLDYERCAGDIRNTLNIAMSETVDGFNAFLGSNETLSDIYLELASQYFWNTNEMLRSQNIHSDTRMTYTHLIWGGEEPNAERATEMADAAATTMATLYAPSTAPTETPVPRERVD